MTVLHKFTTNIGSPLPNSKLEKRSIRAATVIGDFLTQAQEQVLIPDSVIANCKGLVFLSVVKVKKQNLNKQPTIA